MLRNQKRLLIVAFCTLSHLALAACNSGAATVQGVVDFTAAFSTASLVANYQAAQGNAQFKKILQSAHGIDLSSLAKPRGSVPKFKIDGLPMLGVKPGQAAAEFANLGKRYGTIGNYFASLGWTGATKVTGDDLHNAIKVLKSASTRSVPFEIDEQLAVAKLLHAVLATTTREQKSTALIDDDSEPTGSAYALVDSKDVKAYRGDQAEVKTRDVWDNLACAFSFGLNCNGRNGAATVPVSSVICGKEDAFLTLDDVAPTAAGASAPGSLAAKGAAAPAPTGPGCSGAASTGLPAKAMPDPSKAPAVKRSAASTGGHGGSGWKQDAAGSWRNDQGATWTKSASGTWTSGGG